MLPGTTFSAMHSFFVCTDIVVLNCTIKPINVKEGLTRMRKEKSKGYCRFA